MEDEIPNFFKAWFSISISLYYCYAIGKTVPRGIARLVFIFPVICLFLLLPLNLHSLHLGGLTAFFIAWLANFKLLLFAFGQGPLASSPLSISSFWALASLPIKFQQDPLPNSSENGEINKNGAQKSSRIHQKEEVSSSSLEGHESPSNYVVKILLVAALVRAYDYSETLPQKVVWLLLCFHIYFLLELSLAMAATLARSSLGVVLEPQFNRPYLSTSLQDFWGKRWNLTVTRILRPTVYQPTLHAAAAVVGRRWAPLVAVMATFLVSAIMHELMFYYMSRARPTWEVTSFFVLHGVCLTSEIVLKKLWAESWRLPPLPPLLCTPLTLGFFFSTCFWLFFPPFIGTCKADVRVVEEYAILGAFVRNKIPGYSSVGENG